MRARPALPPNQSKSLNICNFVEYTQSHGRTEFSILSLKLRSPSSDRFAWPCDSGSLRSAASSLERTSLSPRILGILVRKPAMPADPHGPSPKFLLCNAGAGAAAGASDFFPRSVFVWFLRKSRKITTRECGNSRFYSVKVLKA